MSVCRHNVSLLSKRSNSSTPHGNAGAALVSSLWCGIGVVLSVAVLSSSSGFASAARPVDPSPHLQTPTSTFVSIRIVDECKLNLHEVLPTKGRHLTPFTPVLHPQPFHLHQHYVDATHFGTVGHTAEFHTHRVMVRYADPITGEDMVYVQPDPRILYLDVHRETGGGHHHHHHGHGDGHHHEGEAEEDPSIAHVAREGHVMLWVPSNVPSLVVACGNVSATFGINLINHQDASPPMQQHHQPLRKHFFELDAADETIQFKTMRSTGPPDRVDNVVFLADGFLASDNATFFERVELILSLIDESPTTDPSIQSQKATVPLDRYIAFWNVYAVFQASNQRGASRPLYGISIDDNLKCYHTPQLERAIQCDRSLSQALARVSPAPVLENPDAVLIIVIVNTPIYGGTGLYQRGVIHIGHFFNGTGMILNDNSKGTPATFGSLINHECGHAYGQLLDEYAIGRNGQQPYTEWPNCLQPNAAGNSYLTPIPWQFWIDVFTGTNATLINHYRGKGAGVLPIEYGTEATPMAVCGYNNYYKGSQACMMNSLGSYYMCPQCREGNSKSIFLTEFELQWPRYPLDDHILLIGRDNAAVQGIAGGGVTLHLPRTLTASEYFRVEWFDNNNNSVPGSNDTGCPACLYIAPSVLRTWPNDTLITYSAVIYDESVFIPAVDRALYPFMQQRATFRMQLPSVEPTDPPVTPGNGTNGTANLMRIAAPVSGASAAAYGSYNSPPGSLVDNKGIFVLCVAARPGTNATCSLEFTENSYNFPGDIDQLAQYDEYVLYILGGIGLLCILLWLYASARYKKVAGRVVRPIFKTEFSSVVTLIRRIMMVSSIMFMVGAVGALVASGYFYTKTSFIGKVIIIGGVIVALSLYLMAFVGFWAITNRAKRLVMFNGVIMIVAECVLIAALAITNIVGEEITNTGDYQGELTSWWTDNVKNDPATACGWQGMLSCSGWGAFACNGVFYVREYCPDNCQEYNADYGSSCQSVIQDIVKKWYPIAAACLGVAVGLMAFAIVFNYVYYFSLWHMKKKFRERNNERVYKATARKGIARQDVDKAKALHVLRTLDVGDLQHLVKEFKRIDEDGNGTLSKKELGIFFRKALCYKITLDELTQIFQAMDLDGDGSISVDEFLAVFRPEEAAAVQSSGHALLHLPQDSTEMPLVKDSQLDRQRRVRERLENTFQNSGVFESHAGNSNRVHASFQPQAQGSPAQYAPPMNAATGGPPQGLVISSGFGGGGGHPQQQHYPQQQQQQPPMQQYGGGQQMTMGYHRSDSL